MKKILSIILCTIILTPSVHAAGSFTNIFHNKIFKNDTREIKSLLNSQVKYANKTNFEKFISTYDKDYLNGDGLNLEAYSNLVKDVWESYDKIVYGIKIKDINITDDVAHVEVVETSNADISLSTRMNGVLKSEANSIYHLKKSNGNWKVLSDEVLSETTSMLYGDARNLDISLVAPNKIQAGEEYTASLEFRPPDGVIAIASIANDKVKYPQEQPKEVYRKLPEDNTLERLFVSNSENYNEYIVATIGLTKADIEDLSIKLSLTGFGYKIIRVNVISKPSEVNNDEVK